MPRIIAIIAIAVTAWQVYVWYTRPEPQPVPERAGISRIIVEDPAGNERTYWSK